MRARAVDRLGRSDRRSWLGRVRDALDALVRSSPARFAILVFAGLILVFTLLFSLPIAKAGTGSGAPLYDAFFTAVSVICVTGLSTVDTQIADALLRAARAARLLGADVMLTGVRPEFAQVLVQLGIDMSGIATKGTLQSGIAAVLGRRPGRVR